MLENGEQNREGGGRQREKKRERERTREGYNVSINSLQKDKCSENSVLKTTFTNEIMTFLIFYFLCY